ncbi:MAG TPA: cysteine--tRNA ligase [Clostridiales bacterium]|nr:MAG: Cysteine--tRNA ligase [Firmicutes bacterium ADurb.Bin262]HOU10359.1 cysteine--tRNA ligase [Clostridiales bacterium]HQH62512.1 cysteine--tRNA ligase [Clostridiales bacterium]
MKIYNTLTRTKEELHTLVPGEVRIYACGPTVYNLIHIGNARPLCVLDVLRNYLEYRGFKVIFAQNFTDIDDKIINRAAAEGLNYEEIAEKYIREYWTDARGLNVKPATFHPKATENIDEIIRMTADLIDGGYAYESEGDVYFSPSKFEGYGKLSKQQLEELESGARVSVGETKREAADFALWKAAKEGEPSWDSPWGKGRPGWHIECSAMVRKYLGTTIDIHCGGQDLIFPHHENEIAQSECANHAPFAAYWMHNGYINVDNTKMSKSLGNFFTVRDVAAQYGYEPIRYLMVSSQYRSPVNYSTEVIEQCIASLSRLSNCRENLSFFIANTLVENNAADEALTAKYEARKQAFIDAMEDDLNTADAIASIFELVKDINTAIADASASKLSCVAGQRILDELCGVLGLACKKESGMLDADVEKLIAERTAARQEKNWARADEIRDTLKKMGIVLEDTPHGVKWSRQ